ncbi:MAG: hypothetical protein HXX11_09035 [Desulfuromonadales bacterium]|nr:hypothetical protein [Desulfuromonadales bacterium]
MNTRKLFAFALFSALLLFFQVSAWGAVVPMVTQSISLNPGWNAVYLEVQPMSNSPAVVFKDLPSGSSVWAWTGKNDSVQFVQDPSEAPVITPKWLAIFASAAESGLNNLYAITANSAYLIHVAGSSPLTMNIDGRPTIRHKGWVPDSFNLTGFGFSSTPPTFATFFASSNSHKNQAIYRLNTVTGAWEMVSNPATTAMRSGEAFWIYCQSGSDYQGPLTVEADNADGLDFGAGITILSLTVNNSSTLDRAVTVTQLNAASPVSLAFRTYDATSGKILTSSLSGMPPLTVKAGGSTVISLEAMRGSFTGSAATVLEFTDVQGNRVRVPVTAISNPINSYPGLWSGVTVLNKVSQLSDLTGTAPDFVSGEATTTPAELNLNLILHQDTNGQVRLLKQVIVMYRDGRRNLDGTPASNGKYVALTDDKLIPNYKGVAQKDGTAVGRRLSAIGFDYSPSTDASFGTDFDNTALKCSGSISSTVTCRLILESSASSTHPTNPFLHRYHPDHDNLASDYTTFKQEVNRIVRDVTLVFDSTPKTNPSNSPPGWGVSVLGGTYTEYIRGLAKGPIKVEGNFTLKLAADVQILNQ